MFNSESTSSPVLAHASLAVRQLIFWCKTHKRFIVLFVGAFLALDWIFVDRLQVVGRVVDPNTGHGVSDAWVEMSFYGETPLINLPIPPHPNHRTSTCMDSRTVQTNRWGWFVLDEVTLNRQLANKSVSVSAFKPGWLESTGSKSISTAVVGLPAFLTLQVRRGPGVREETTKRGPGAPAEGLPAIERTRTEELLNSLSIVVDQPCGRAGFELSKIAMTHAIEIAATYDERERTVASCGYAKNSLVPRANSSRLDRDQWFRFFESDYVWPFDCDNLPFKKQPSPEVLAVEAEVAADRRRRLEKRSKNPGQ